MPKKIPKKISNTIREYIHQLQREIPINRVILYGSHAKGRAKKNSDIDLAIVSPKFGRDPHEDGKYLFRMLWRIRHSNIDPIGYSPKNFNVPKPSPLLHEIKKHGIEIRL